MTRSAKPLAVVAAALANLPERRGSALDVGCGRGELLAALSPYFGEVRGIDVDEEMRAAALQRAMAYAAAGTAHG